MRQSKWLTNGQVTRRSNGEKDEALLRTLGFRECEAPVMAKRSERKGRYAGR